MKKIILSLGLLAGISGAAHAQSIKYGVKAGASLTSLTGSDSDGTKNKFGFNGGVLANFGINDMFSIQPEVLYSNKGYKFDGGQNGLRLALNYIDVPVLVKIATGSTGLFFELGPQVGFRLAADVKDDDNSASIKDYTKGVDFGYAGGLGYQIESGPMIGLRYNGGFTKIGKDGSISGIPVTAANAKNSAFQLYIGYMFGGK
ncbi:MAG: porin family protein [Janthinobacterium lividum]